MNDQNKAALLCAGNLRLGAGYEHQELDYEAEGHIRRLVAENAALTAQRDELLAALKRIAGRCDAEPAYKIAHAAIAKVEVGK